MPRIRYQKIKFTPKVLQTIDRANGIVNAMASKGYDLTLRQLYYQFVSRDWMPNTVQDYKRLGSTLSRARRAGLVDWSAIVDRTRNLRSPSTWNSPGEIIGSCASQFTVDLRADQKYRPEVWVEKDALVGVMQVACGPQQAPYFSCRGYASDSELWAAAQRMDEYTAAGQTPIVLHFGDHDPSGIDMTRDIEERLELFSMKSRRVEVRRLALTMDQVREYNPPPNPAKETDSRFKAYRDTYGDESWELDALNPETITDIIRREIDTLIQRDLWNDAQANAEHGRSLLRGIVRNWNTVCKVITNV